MTSKNNVTVLYTQKGLKALEDLADWEDDNVEVDKCLQCGRWRATEKLTYPDQRCVEGCKNPNEY